MPVLCEADLLQLQPSVLGVSKPITIDQSHIDAFSVASRDYQWIHTDPERASRGPFGATIAHGFLTLSLTAAIVDEVLQVEGARLTVNYGVDRVRFPTPLISGSVVRGRVELLDTAEHPLGTRSQVRVTITAEGGTKPCCIADLVVLHAWSDLP